MMMMIGRYSSLFIAFAYVRIFSLLFSSGVYAFNMFISYRFVRYCQCPRVQKCMLDLNSKQKTNDNEKSIFLKGRFLFGWWKILYKAKKPICFKGFLMTVFFQIFFKFSLHDFFDQLSLFPSFCISNLHIRGRNGSHQFPKWHFKWTWCWVNWVLYCCTAIKSNFGFLPE